MGTPNTVQGSHLACAWDWLADLETSKGDAQSSSFHMQVLKQQQQQKDDLVLLNRFILGCAFGTKNVLPLPPPVPVAFHCFHWNS